MSTDIDTKLPKRSLKENLQSIGYVSLLAFRQQPWLVGLNAISSVVSATVPILSSYLLGRLTTTLYEAATTHTVSARPVFILIIAIAVIELFRALLQGYIYTMSSYLDDRMRIEMRLTLAKKFATLDFASYESKEASDKYDRAKDFTGNVGWVFRRSLDVASSIIASIGAGFALASISPYIALILVIGLIPSVLLRIKIQRERHEYWRRNTANRRIAYLAEDDLSDPKSIREVRILGLVDHLIARARGLREQELEEERKYDVRQRRQQTAEDTLASVVETSALLWVAAKIIYSGLAVGQFVFFQQVMQQFTGRVSSLFSSFQGITEDLQKSHDFYEFMSQPDLAERKIKLSAKHTPSIVFDHVWFKYPGSNRYVLEDVSLTIEPGKKVALVGENGAGKSTLIKLILGLYQPEKGEVRIDGNLSKDVDFASWFSHIGILFQDFERFAFTTVKENVQYGRIDANHSDAAVEKALELAKVDFLNELPKGMDSYLSKHIDEKAGTDLSGGQWQRIALARSFYRNSDVLILDEPTSAIDAKAEFEIFENVMKVAERHTAIIVSHRFSTVRKADYIYVLDHGKLIEEGMHQDLLTKNGMYKELFEKQAAGYR